MIRLEKISGVLDSFGRPIHSRAGVSRGLRAKVLIGIVLVLATAAFGLGVSVMAGRTVTTEDTNASPMETPPDLATAPATATKDMNDVPTGQLPIIVTAPTVNATVGTDIEVTITTTNTTGFGIAAYQGDLLYDPTVLLPQPTPSNVSGTISGLTGQFIANPLPAG